VSAFPAAATDYYVTVTGDDHRLGTSPAEAWRTIARVNEQVFACGDRVLFRRGDTWRERLAPRSGCDEPGRYVTYGAWDRGYPPTISAADLVRGWEPSDVPDVWRATLPHEPRIVTFDRELGRFRPGGIDDLEAEGDWFWEQETLWILSPAGVPDIAFMSPGVEAGQRQNAIEIGPGRPNLVFEGLHLVHCNVLPDPFTTGQLHTSGAQPPGAELVVRDCRFSLAYDRTGTHPDNDHSRVCEGILIEDSSDWILTVEDSVMDRVGHGIEVGRGTEATIRHNRFHDLEDDCVWLLDPEAGAPVHRVVGNVCVAGGDEGIQADGPAEIVHNTIYGTSDTGIKVARGPTVVRNNLIVEPGRATNEYVAQGGVGLSVIWEGYVSAMDHNSLHKRRPEPALDEGFEGETLDPYWDAVQGGAVVTDHPATGSAAWLAGDGGTLSLVGEDWEWVGIDFSFRIDSSSTLASGTAMALGRIELADGTGWTIWLSVDAAGDVYVGMNDGRSPWDAPALDHAVAPKEYHAVEFRRHTSQFGDQDGIVRLYVDGERRKTLTGVEAFSKVVAVRLGEVAGDRGEFVVHLDDVRVWPRFPEALWEGNSYVGAKRSEADWMAFGWPLLQPIDADPMLRDPEAGNVRLAPGSPAIDAAVDLGLERDVAGNPRVLGAAPDVGAFEFDPAPGLVDDLRLGRTGEGELVLTWGADCGGAELYSLYRGDLDRGLSSARVEPGRCDVAERQAIVPGGPGLRDFFLVVPHAGGLAGSYGRLGDGTPRAPLSGACHPPGDPAGCAR
jgi:hypothetical protein